MLAFVASSRASTPASALRRSAASVTVRHMGPAVSWLCAIGIMPARLTRPSVGLILTSEFAFDDFASACAVLAGVTAAAIEPDRLERAKAAVRAEMWPDGDGRRRFRNDDQASAVALFAAAMARGGDDNISLILLRVEQDA